jgi:Ni/Fe-hydrogenase subunit HybB-like protein
VLFLLIDLGRPWRLPYPMVVSFGTASVLFLVAWHVALYLTCQFLEVLPSISHWGGWKRLERWATNLTIVLTIFGVILSTLHQSALGAMYLIAPTKLHPLWYSPYLPVLFLVSAIAAGLCLMIVVGYLTRRFMSTRASRGYMEKVDGVSFGLAKGASFVLITYFGLKIVALAHGNNWDLLATSYGSLYIVELILSTVVPFTLLVVGLKRGSLGLIRFGAVTAVAGIILYRFNVSMVALNWQIPNRVLTEFPEVMIVIGVVAAQILLYKWVVNRMPILEEEAE